MPSSTPASSGGSAHPLPPPAVLAPSPAGHHYQQQVQHQVQHQHQQGPASASPLHPPSAYYPPPATAQQLQQQQQQQPSSSSISSTSPSADSRHHHLRDKPQQQPASGRVYDPTTDTTKERPIADSRHNAPQVATPKVSSSTLAIVHFHFSALSPPRHALCLLSLLDRTITFFFKPFLQTKKKDTISLPPFDASSPKIKPKKFPPIHHPCHAYIIAIPDF
jgi:hypothetical protein